MTTPSDAIEDYLDELLLQLRGRTRSVRRILEETEDHLREASQQAATIGLSEAQAQRVAIARFGSPRTVARRFARGTPGPPTSATLVALLHAAAYLASVGLLAIGASGLLTEVFGRGFGPDMVAGHQAPVVADGYPMRGVTYTSGQCNTFQDQAPEGYDCLEAAAWHHWHQTVEYRVTAGALGVVLGTGLVWWRRRTHRREAEAVAVLPDGFVPTIGASLFGTAAAVLLLAALDLGLVDEGKGSGQYLSGGLVALVVFGVFGYRLYRTLSIQTITVTALPNDHAHSVRAGPS